MSDPLKTAERAIRAAFRDTERPAQLASMRFAELEELTKDLGYRPWAELTSDELLRHRDALGMMDADAFRYYLPAFLVATLDRERPGYSTDLRETVLFALGPYLVRRGPDPVMERRFHARIATLDDTQLDAIRAYLRVVREQVAHPKEFAALDLKGVWLSPPPPTPPAVMP